ncbi:uncharacterized protein LOC111021568, partial [Momordica charantia]|uniref:Uncharacterized protein LOC111021568 n=1 Tax=Momordica charantia TaxID=3673 RepID=A0A6J1DJW6_MOMCH
MERIRATSKMSFINGGLSQKTVIGCNNNNNYFIPPSDHHHHHHFLARCTVLDDSSELSIFDAKKYFNEVSSNCINKVSPVTSLDSTSISEDHLCEVRDSDQDSESRSKSSWACGVTHPVSPTVVSKFSPTSTSAPVDGYRHRSYHARSFHSATPTASSEASWNSQTGLLSNPPGAISVSVLRGDSDHDLEKKTRRPLSASSAAARWIFRSSKCPCSGKKSVQVQELKVIVSSDHLKTSPPNNYINNNPPQPSPPESLSDPVNTTIAIVGENTMVLQQSDQNDVVWSTQRRFPPNLLLQGQTTTQRVIASTGFTFPILKNNNGEFPIRAVNASLIQDPPRDSLEVFRPSSARDDGGTSLKSRILASAVASG